MSGRCSERLVEEISQCTVNGIFPYTLTPIQEYELLNTGSESIGRYYDGYTTDLPTKSHLFNAYFPETRLHLQIEEFGLIESEHDWRLIEEADHTRRATLKCSITSSHIRIDWYTEELTQKIKDTFTLAALQARFEAYSSATPTSQTFVHTPDFSDIEQSFQMYTRIITDLLKTPPLERRSVRAVSSKASTLLDLPVVLPFLGFNFNEAENLYDPPKQDSQQFLNWLRRILIEISPKPSHKPVVPALSTFLHCETANLYEDPNLVAEYACLGATAGLSDDRIYQRYLLASQADTAGTPYYLEALLAVAQGRASDALEMRSFEQISAGVQTFSMLSNEMDKLGLDVASANAMSDEELTELALNSGDAQAISFLKALISLRKQQHRDTQVLDSIIRMANVSSEEVKGMFGEDVEENFMNAWTNGPPSSRLEARLALRALALAENAPQELLILYERVASEPLPDLKTAYNTLDVDFSSEVNEHSIMASFIVKSENVGIDKLLELRRALRTIADDLDSAQLWHFLGYTDVETERPKMPPGLWNIGNTCYLNSLLQFYYSLPEIRDYAESVTKVTPSVNTMVEIEEVDLTACEPETKAIEEDADVSSLTESESDIQIEEVGESANQQIAEAETDSETEKIVGGRKVSRNEIQRSKIFVSMLGQLFKDMSETKIDYVTPSDLLAYMALVPAQEDADDVTTNGPQTLQGRLSGALQRQQDVTECIENVLDQLEATMPSESRENDGEQIDLVKLLFYGTTIQVLQRISDNGNRRTKTERFSSLLVDVGNGPSTLYSAIDNYFANDVLELEDGMTLRTLRISRLPRILQVQVQRVQYDREFGTPYKNCNPMVFDEIVYMDRYLETEPDSKLGKKHKQVDVWKDELMKLNELISSTQSEVLDSINGLETTISWFDSIKEESEEGNDDTIKVSESTVQQLRDHATSLRESLDVLLAQRVELESLLNHAYDDFTEHKYRLHALFIHKGDVSYGHYWIYIRNPETGGFLKYNDEYVSEVPREEVFNFAKQPATPYFLAFVKLE